MNLVINAAESIDDTPGTITITTSAQEWRRRDLTDAELIANADARQFGDWEYVCGMLDVFGAPCQACSDGVEACVGLHVAQIEGAAQGGVVIQEVTDPGAECDPGTDTKE